MIFHGAVVDGVISYVLCDSVRAVSRRWREVCVPWETESQTSSPTFQTPVLTERNVSG